MIRLTNKETGEFLGEITEEQFQFIMDRLEEESEEDDDYYLNRATLDGFREQGADPALLEILEKALGEKEEGEIRWTRS